MSLTLIGMFPGYLFMCVCISAVLGLHCCVVRGRSYPLLMVHSFSSLWLPWLWSWCSRHVGFRTGITQAQESELRDTGTQAQQPWRTGSTAPRHMESSQNGDQPVSPPSAGGFLTTRPPGKSFTHCFFHQYNSNFSEQILGLFLCVVFSLVFSFPF